MHSDVRLAQAVELLSLRQFQTSKCTRISYIQSVSAALSAMVDIGCQVSGAGCEAVPRPARRPSSLAGSCAVAPGRSASARRLGTASFFPRSGGVRRRVRGKNSGVTHRLVAAGAHNHSRERAATTQRCRSPATGRAQQHTARAPGARGTVRTNCTPGVKCPRHAGLLDGVVMISSLADVRVHT
jgi:hypothetical protein